MDLMKAVVFRGPGIVELEERKKPVPRAGQAVIRITTTTICGTDVHIVKGEYPVKPGRVLGHEPVGIIDSLGEGLDDEYFVGQRVVVGAITPCGQCFYCLNAAHSQCGGALGGWRFGNTIDGAWAEYLLVPDARANLAPIPEGLTDEEVVLVTDIFSTGLSGAESGNVELDDERNTGIARDHLAKARNAVALPAKWKGSLSEAELQSPAAGAYDRRHMPRTRGSLRRSASASGNDEVLEGLDEMSLAEVRQIRETPRRIERRHCRFCSNRPADSARAGAGPSTAGGRRARSGKTGRSSVHDGCNSLRWRQLHRNSDPTTSSGPETTSIQLKCPLAIVVAYTTARPMNATPPIYSQRHDAPTTARSTKAGIR